MSSRKLFVMSVVSLALIVSACAPAVATTPEKVVVKQVPPTAKAMDTPGSIKLNASGATFPQPLYEDWAFAFSQRDPSVVINYAGGGSGQGIKDIKAGTVDFAGTDALLSDKDYKDAPSLQMLPTVAGAVVLAYNIKGVTQTLTLDANTVVGIYQGTIANWNDPAIAILNPEAKFPDLPINVVH